jgi:hypothetical protein
MPVTRNKNEGRHFAPQKMLQQYRRPILPSDAPGELEISPWRDMVFYEGQTNEKENELMDEG